MCKRIRHPPLHSTTAFFRSCSIASAILYSMWNDDFVKELERGCAFYCQDPCLILADYLSRNYWNFRQENRQSNRC